MSSSLDQSLDAIVASQPKQHRRSRPSKSNATNGGVKKAATKSNKPNAAAKGSDKVLPKIPLSHKIIIHGLPSDIKEKEIKQYLTTSVGPVARVELAYNAQGTSKGTATIVFKQVSGQNPAQKAVASLNNRNIDSANDKRRVLKVEIVTEIPQPTLAERLAAPANAARGSKAGKGATAVPATKNVKTKKLQKTGPGRVKRVAKTSEELDAEMTDYFASK